MPMQPGPAIMTDPTLAVNVTTVDVVYTAQELLKIRVAGGILAIAVLIFAFVGYQYFRVRQKNWERRERMEEMMRQGVAYDYEDFKPIAFSVDRRIVWGFAGFMIVAGLILTFIL